MKVPFPIRKKTIVILGAGNDQVFLIRTAKRLGLKVIAFDKNPNAPGFSYADFPRVISSRDVKKIIPILKDYQQRQGKIHGVATMGSDIPQIVVKLANFLRTPSISYKAALLATNKYDMKKKFTEFNVNTPPYILASELEQVKSAFHRFNKVVVIKPLDQAGSRGVSLIKKEDDLKIAFESAKKFSNYPTVLVEKFLSGPQISTESILFNGEIYTPGYADRNYEDLEIFLPQIMENGGTVPSVLTCKKAIVEEQIQKAADSIGIKNGVIKGDVVLSDNVPYVVEIAARLSGGDFSESLVPLGSGVNYVETVIKYSIGDVIAPSDFKQRFNNAVANRYFFAACGKLKEVGGVEAVKNKHWVKKLDIWYSPGDVLPQINSHGARTGVFVVVADDKETLKNRISWVYKTITFEIESIDEL